jgi:hypothetical protein
VLLRPFLPSAIAAFDLRINERSSDYSQWVDAVRATTRADVSADVIDVRGLTGDAYDGADSPPKRADARSLIRTTSSAR